MAESPAILMFPDLRRSVLEKEVRERRLAFERSRDAFLGTVRRKAGPLHYLRRHPRAAIGASLVGFSLIRRLLRSVGVVSGERSSFLWKVVKAGWFWKIAKMSIGYVMDRNGPALRAWGFDLATNLLRRRFGRRA